MQTSIEKIFQEVGRLHVQLVTLQEQALTLQQQLVESQAKCQAVTAELEALKNPKAEGAAA